MRETTNNALDAALRGSMTAPTRWDAVKIMAKAGFSILLLEPGSKDPVDMRSAVEKANDAKRDPRLGAGGLWSATTKLDRLGKYWDRAVERFGAEPNVGIHVEWTGLVTIDADQAHETEGVQRMALDGQEGVPLAAYAPTVTSPGSRKADGEWIHSGGGHFHFHVDVEDLPLVKEFKLPDGAVVSMTGRYYAAPPSVRAEGPYRVTGPVRPLSEAPWLVDLIRAQAQTETVEATRRVEAAEERRERREKDGPSSVEAWNDARSWDEILPAYGWTPAGKADGCGCPIWTAPGDHDSPKSATAHEGRCSNRRVELEGESGPLHIWTSSRPEPLEGQDRWTKAQFVAAMEGKSMGRFLADEGLVDESADAETMVLEVDAETEERFWRSYPALERLRNFARARRSSPWAVLGASLAMVSAAIPAYVVLPALVGRRGSLNFYVGIVAPSGGGKGTATGAARDALVGLPDTYMNEAGSGEGLVKAFGIRNRKADDQNTYVVRDAMIVDVPEVESLYSVTGRQGATFSAVFRKGWSGESLGFQYADNTKAAMIPAMAYRLAAIVGIQPLLSGPWLGEHAGGLPQRFVYLPTTDPGFTRDDRAALLAALGDGPEPVVDMSHIRRDFPPLDPFRIVLDDTADEAGDDGEPREPKTVSIWRPLRPEEYREVKVCRSAVEAVEEETEARLSASIDDMVDPEAELGGHRTQLRLKAAAVLSALVGEGGEVTEDLWDLAGVLLAKSDETVGRIRSALRKHDEKVTTARGRKDAAREMARRDNFAKEAQTLEEQATAKVWEYLQDGGAHPLRPLRDRFPAGPRRDAFVSVLDTLVEDGLVERVRTGKAWAIRYVGNEEAASGD